MRDKGGNYMGVSCSFNSSSTRMIPVVGRSLAYTFKTPDTALFETFA